MQHCSFFSMMLLLSHGGPVYMGGLIKMTLAQSSPQGYLMYVWNDGFYGKNTLDATVATAKKNYGGNDNPGIDKKTEMLDNDGDRKNHDGALRHQRMLPPLSSWWCPATHPTYFNKTAYPQCFDETWDTKQKRRELWGAVRTAVPPERRVTHILLSRVSDIVEEAGPESLDCQAAGTETLKATLREARAPNVNAKVYALFAIDDEAFSEADKVPHVVAWNQYCAKCDNEKFDGVAINNERFTSKKCNTDGSQEFILDRLWAARMEADLGGLKLHMSIGWHWGWCSVGSGILNNVTWGPTAGTEVTQPANQHFIDIADSVDAQVSWNTPSTMATRATKAGAAYAETLNKPFWVLAYTNPSDDDCRFTFFPTVGGCSTGNLTMAGLWDAFDQMVDTGGSLSDPVPAARGGIHYFRGSYGTDILGWPELLGPNVIPYLCAEKDSLLAKKKPQQPEQQRVPEHARTHKEKTPKHENKETSP